MHGSGILQRCFIIRLRLHAPRRRLSEPLRVAVDLRNTDAVNPNGKQQQRAHDKTFSKQKSLLPFTSSSKKVKSAMSEEDECSMNALLSPEQNALVQKMLQGHNIYFTGKAGTGKSLVIKKFVNDFSKLHPKKKLAAPTGIAASLINGQTFHSFLGFPVFLDNLDDQKFKNLIENIKKTPWKKKAYTKTDVLVIDEASMLHPTLFDMLNILMKELRGKETRHLPFGGLQVIISGDFFQLPPVVKRNTGISYHSKDVEKQKVLNSCISRGEGNIPYLFDSRAWAELMHANMKTIELTNVFRQTDPVFLSILEEIRMGYCSPRTWEILEEYKEESKKWPSDGIMPTQISAYRSDADKRNYTELKNLNSGPMKTFKSVDFLRTDNGLANSEILFAPPDINTIESHLGSFQPSRILELKRFAQVILIRNLSLEDGLVNGSKGFIADFVDAYDSLSGQVVNLPLVQFANGSQYVIGYVEFTAPFKNEDTYLVRRQIPLKLGWALTIHKSQGMTLDRVDIDIHSAFAPGHAYVAISRVKNLSGLRLLNFTNRSLITNHKVLTFYSSVFSQNNQKAIAQSN